MIGYSKKKTHPHIHFGMNTHRHRNHYRILQIEFCIYTIQSSYHTDCYIYYRSQDNRSREISICSRCRFLVLSSRWLSFLIVEKYG